MKYVYFTEWFAVVMLIVSNDISAFGQYAENAAARGRMEPLVRQSDTSCENGS